MIVIKIILWACSEITERKPPAQCACVLVECNDRTIIKYLWKGNGVIEWTCMVWKWGPIYRGFCGNYDIILYLKLESYNKIKDLRCQDNWLHKRRNIIVRFIIIQKSPKRKRVLSTYNVVAKNGRSSVSTNNVSSCTAKTGCYKVYISDGRSGKQCCHITKNIIVFILYYDYKNILII